MNRSENRTCASTRVSCVQVSGLQASGLQNWRLALLAVAASCAILQSASASPRLQPHPPEGPPPCPNIERLCGSSINQKLEDPIQQLCQCAPGVWVRKNTNTILNPPTPIHSYWAESENFVGWRISCNRRAVDNSASVSVSINGSSSFWHAGSRTESHLGQFTGGWQESWNGTSPACARSVLLAAVGSGGLGIGATCSATLGCSASSSATESGTATSHGNASASCRDLEIHGTAEYDNVTHLSKINGNFGSLVTRRLQSIKYFFSSQISWTTEGQGAASGGLTFSVLPDRTYCALTNLPLLAVYSGTVGATTAVTVDDNGSAAGSASATLTLSIN